MCWCLCELWLQIGRQHSCMNSSSSNQQAGHQVTIFWCLGSPRPNRVLQIANFIIKGSQIPRDGNTTWIAGVEVELGALVDACIKCSRVIRCYIDSWPRHFQITHLQEAIPTSWSRIDCVVDGRATSDECLCMRTRSWHRWACCQSSRSSCFTCHCWRVWMWRGRRVRCRRNYRCACRLASQPHVSHISKPQG